MSPSSILPVPSAAGSVSVFQTAAVDVISARLFTFSLYPDLPPGPNAEPEAPEPSSTPRATRRRPGPRREPICDFQRRIPVPLATPSRAKRAMTTEFKLGVLSWWHHTKVDDSKGGFRISTRTEVQKKFGIKNKSQLTRWRNDEAQLLQQKGSSKRKRPSCPRWPALEKALVLKFAERRKAGRVVRRKWFERTAKTLFLQLYPLSVMAFLFSVGWFNRFLVRNEITLRVITNKAQETPEQYLSMIINFLCFNRRNSQLRDGTADLLFGILHVGRYLLSGILNMDQTPLPWEYLEGKTYEFKGKKTVWVRSKRSGWGKRQATIQLTAFADGVPRVKPLVIFRGAEESNRAPRRREAKRYDPRVVVKFNMKAYANTTIILAWLNEQLVPVLGKRPTLLVMDLLGAHKTHPVKELLASENITLSMIPAGCTGLVQPLDVSINRPFKDLLKQAIEDELDRREIEPEDVHGESAVGEMRVMMTHCVGEAWTQFSHERREVVIKSFRQLGLSLPINGSSDGEISIKGLKTAPLMSSICAWKTQGLPDIPPGESSSTASSESEDHDFLNENIFQDLEIPAAEVVSSTSFGIDEGYVLPVPAVLLPAASRATRSRVVLPRSEQRVITPASLLAADLVHKPLGLRLQEPRAVDSEIVPGLEAGLETASSALMVSGSERTQLLPVPTIAVSGSRRGRAHGKGQIRGSRNATGRHLVAKTTVLPAAKDLPAVGVRRSQRLLTAGEPQSYLVRFPGLCESEPEDEDDGVEFDFRWERDEF